MIMAVLLTRALLFPLTVPKIPWGDNRHAIHHVIYIATTNPLQKECLFKNINLLITLGYYVHRPGSVYSFGLILNCFGFLRSRFVLLE